MKLTYVQGIARKLVKELRITPKKMGFSPRDPKKDTDAGRAFSKILKKVATMTPEQWGKIVGSDTTEALVLANGQIRHMANLTWQTSGNNCPKHFLCWLASIITLGWISFDRYQIFPSLKKAHRL